jgi:hypothetical protein
VKAVRKTQTRAEQPVGSSIKAPTSYEVGMEAVRKAQTRAGAACRLKHQSTRLLRGGYAEAVRKTQTRAEQPVGSSIKHPYYEVGMRANRQFLVGVRGF